MSQVRLAALATLLAAAGCYADAPPQSTLPEPRYVSGPPGGAMDPGYATPPYAGRSRGAEIGPAQPQVGEDGDDGDDGVPTESPPPAPAPLDEAQAGPAAPGDPGDLAQIGPPPGAPGAPTPGTATVSDDEVDAALDGYGQWIDTEGYGQVWRPDATVVGVDFTPYESGGSWAYTDAGWAFASDYPWGWLPFHYGRWGWFGGYWGWVPGHRWGPAWVEWRHGGGVVGWRPLAPGRGSDHRWHGGDAPFRDHRGPEQHDAHWRFATSSDFSRPHIRAHLFGNTAEGLRVTSTVAAPPLRGAVTVRSADLMKGRFAAGRLAQPGISRGFGPRPSQPAGRSYPPPARAYQPPAQAYRPPAYQGPARGYQPPARTYAPTQSYRPPVYSSPARSYRPPARSYQPPAYTGAPSHGGPGGGPSGGSSSSSHSSASSSSSHSSSSSSSSHTSSGGGHHR